MSGGNRPWPSSRGLCRALLLVCLLPLAAAASDQPSPLLLQAGATLHEKLDGGQRREYRIELPAGQAAELSLRQLGDRAPELRWTGRDELPPLQPSAGRGAMRGLVQIGQEASAWQFTVAAKSKGYAVTYDLTLGDAHPVSEADRKRAAAQLTMARGDEQRQASGSAETGRNAGDPAARQALDTYESAAAAWQAAADDCGLRQVFNGMARLQLAHADYRGAVAYADRALALHCGPEGLAAGPDLAEALRTRGAALAYLGQLTDAIGEQERALALYRKTGDLRFQGVVSGNLSANYADTGQSGAALRAAQDALQAAQTEDDAQGVEFSRERIAALLFADGRYGDALDQLLGTQQLLQQTPYPMVDNMVWNDLGLVYRQLGEPELAKAAYGSSAAVARANDDRAAVAEALANQADAELDAGRPDNARSLFQSALDLATAGGFDRQRADALRGLGLCDMKAGQWSSARAQLEAALDLARRDRLAVASFEAELALGDLESAQDRAGAAREHYASAYALAREAHDAAEQPVALASLARSQALRGELAAARRNVERALALVETERARIRDPGLRTSYFASRRAYYDLYIDILMQLQQRHPGRGYDGAALEAAENARARSLRDMLVERGTVIVKDADPALIAQEREAEDAAHAAAYQLDSLAANTSVARRAPLQRLLDQASARLDQARGALRGASPRYAEISQPRPLTLAELRPLLDDDTSVFEYWLGEHRSYLWVLGRRTLRSYTLPAGAALEAEAAALRELLAARAPADLPIQQLDQWRDDNRSAVEAAGRKLGALLLPAGLPARSRLLIVADGGLQLIPFGMLAAPAEQGSLGDAHDLAYLPSVATLHWLRRDEGWQARPRPLAVFADPVFRGDDPRLPQHQAAGAPPVIDPRLLPLPHSREEAAAAARLFPAGASWQALGFDASRQAALDARWRDHGIVHFATHTLLDLRHPDLSGVVLSLYRADGQAVDGYLRMNDIYNLDLPADLVVLSACESALGRKVDAEGVYSLARAFFYAGAPRVLGTLWAVDDRASAVFMGHFYDALLAPGGTPLAALRGARQAMQADPRWNSPYYWAGYVLQGDWR